MSKPIQELKPGQRVRVLVDFCDDFSCHSTLVKAGLTGVAEEHISCGKPDIGLRHDVGLFTWLYFKHNNFDRTGCFEILTDEPDTIKVTMAQVCEKFGCNVEIISGHEEGGE